MFSISFIFKPGTYDDEFHRLGAATEAVANGTEGFLGSEAWWSEDRPVCNARSHAGLRQDRRAIAGSAPSRIGGGDLQASATRERRVGPNHPAEADADRAASREYLGHRKEVLTAVFRQGILTEWMN